jgi:tripartite-type tricarboxylate transporter receptor subunit TctC
MRKPGPILLAGVCALVAWTAPCAHAQDYPARNITLVVPYAAGGGPMYSRA